MTGRATIGSKMKQELCEPRSRPPRERHIVREVWSEWTLTNYIWESRVHSGDVSQGSKSIEAATGPSVQELFLGVYCRSGLAWKDK